MAERQRIIENNRSLRTIKNELENLLERGVITEAAFDSVISQLPSESPLSGGAAAAAAAAVVPTPAATPNPPTAAFAKFGLGASNGSVASPAPPAYNQTAPPALPARNNSEAAAPEKPVIAHARALYKYDAADERDVALERDDRIAVHDKVNAEWWMGRNLRTGREGIFPKTYVLVEQEGDKRPAPPPVPVPAGSMGPVSMATLGNVGGPPQQQAVYNPNAGPAEGKSKMEETGKKFGKKLGNAAIFGAGASIGGKIVNGLF